MNQPQLINTQGMSSARTIARLVRERSLRSYRSALPRTNTSPARLAAALADSPTPPPAISQGKLKAAEKPCPSSKTALAKSPTGPATAEFNLPDEDRFFILQGAKVCPTCGGRPSMERSKAQGFNLRCTWPWCVNRRGKEEFLYHPTSQQAVAHWNMVAALTKL